MSDALLEALGSTGDVLITIDFETYFSADYNLRKCTTEGFVRDPRFQVLGCGVKVAGGPSAWLEEWDFRAWAKRVDWSRVAVLAHHTQFDAFVLSHHYGIRPRFLLCTMSMARAVHGVAGVGLDNLAKVYGLGEKGTELKITKGKRREQLTQAEWALVGGYCRNDVDLTAGLLRAMLPKFPEAELWVVDTTIRAFTEPVFVGDQSVLVKALEDERAKKARVLARIVETTKETDARAVLSSSDKFAALLRVMGEEPPVKPNDKGEDIYAFAKDDPGMQALLDHPRDEIRAVAEARLAIKSTIIETRTERIIGAAKRGRIPFYLKAYGAHTHRWCMKPSAEVLTPGGWRRFDQFTEGSIAQWSPDGVLRWGAATMNSFDFSGELVRTESEYVRGAYTEDHVIPTWTAKGTFTPRTAATAEHKNIRVPVGGSLDSAGVPVSDALLRLFVAVQADGSIEDPESRPLRFKFRKTRKVDRLKALLTDARVPFTEYETPPEHCISIAREHVPPVLWFAKRFGWGLLGLDARQREVFLEELRFWDGVVARADLAYTTTVRQNAEVVAALAACSGRTSIVHREIRTATNPAWADKYTVTMHRRKFVHVQAARWGREQYSGRVYCPSTETGFFLVRSEGRIFVTGNSGGDKMNPQNFNRGGALRDAILAPEGHALVVVDSGQIEARVCPWFAGEQRLLETFRRNDETGGDFYADEGSVYFGKTISKKETPLERQIAKAMALGLQFQMGWGRFAGELLKGMLGADPVQFTRTEVEKFKVDVAAFAERGYGNVTNGQRVQEMIANGQRLPFDDLLVHCAVANHFVWLYRMKNPNITRLWKTAENVLSVMASDTNDGGAVRMRWGCLSVVREGLVKPSGLTLLYPGLRRSATSGFSYLGGPRGVKRDHIYGGLLVENVVQSLARDIVAEQALWIRADGARIGTTTHDEVVAVVPKDQAEQAYQRALTCMRTSPAWCADLPLNASGGFGTSYGAVK